MISDAASNSCYVYITLPGETHPVTAGRFELAADGAGAGAGRFVYGRRYRERKDAVEFDPVELKLSARIYETVRMGGIFGALRDAAPDNWGRRIIERRVGKAQLSEFKYLLGAPDDRAGALGFGAGQTPSAPGKQSNTIMDLEKLQTLADDIVSQDIRPAGGSIQQTGAAEAEELFRLGTSMGGARPKTVVEDTGALWLAKFNRPDDRWDFARVEHAMLRLARQCGVNAAESRVVQVGGRDVLLIKRFDRERADGGWRKARMISGLTLLRADERPGPEWSYILLAEELRRVCARPQEQTHELFRRMCFNALITNTDDHPRNHAVIALGREWALSPAYDLTPAPPTGGSQEPRDLAMACGAEGRTVRRENLLSECGRFLLNRPEAEAILSEMEARVRNNWRAAAEEASVSAQDCEAVHSAFARLNFNS